MSMVYSPGLTVRYTRGNLNRSQTRSTGLDPKRTQAGRICRNMMGFGKTITNAAMASHAIQMAAAIGGGLNMAKDTVMACSARKYGPMGLRSHTMANGYGTKNMDVPKQLGLTDWAVSKKNLWERTEMIKHTWEGWNTIVITIVPLIIIHMKVNGHAIISTVTAWLFLRMAILIPEFGKMGKCTDTVPCCYPTGQVCWRVLDNEIREGYGEWWFCDVESASGDAGKFGSAPFAADDDELRQLRQRIAQLEDDKLCSICMSKQRLYILPHVHMYVAAKNVD